MSYRHLSALTYILVFVAVTALSVFIAPAISDAAVASTIQRIDVKPRTNFTRIDLQFDQTPEFRLIPLSDNRIKIRFKDTAGKFYKTLKQYTDENINKMLLSQNGDDSILTFTLSGPEKGWRVTHLKGVPAISLDVGAIFPRDKAEQQALPGRERIKAGAEKLLRDFDPPLKPEIPFEPTDRSALKNILSPEEQQQFLVAEGALYKGRLTAAEEAFSIFAARDSQIRPLALYRLAEAQYRLQKYGQALETFRSAVQLWPEFLSINPAVMFYFGDSIARNGDLPGGRQLLSRLVVAHADKKYAPVLLVRMADVLTRQGVEENAYAIYSTVSSNFKDNKASQIATLKLADRRFLDSTPDTFYGLGKTYEKIAASTGDYDLREEATFKNALLNAINGSPDVALDAVQLYQRRFPRGVYSTVIRDIREDLVALIYQDKDWSRTPEELIKLVTDNHEFLATAIKLPGFLSSTTTAFEKGGRPLDQISLYSGLLEQPWVSSEAASYLALQVADQSELLGDSTMARKVLQDAMRRYSPGHAQSRWALERLGAIQFNAGEMQEVRKSLAWLLNKQEQATFPASYYYLGRALLEGKDYTNASMAMETYLAVVRGDTRPPVLVADAYYVAASAKLSLNDTRAATSLLESGLELAEKERKDQFMYKLAELAAVAGQYEQSRSLYEKIVNEGHDPDWQRLARLALEESQLKGKSVQ